MARIQDMLILSLGFLYLCFSQVDAQVGGSVLYDFSGSSLLPRADDRYYSTPLTSSFPFFGNVYTSLYVSTNGILSFDAGVSAYVSSSFPVGSIPLISPFWTDIDTRRYGYIYHRELTSLQLAMVGAEISSVFGAPFNAQYGYLVTWYQVPAYPGYQRSVYNSFQAALVTNGAASIVIFNYEVLNWVVGSASSVPAQMGFDAGDRTNYYSHPLSQTSSITQVVSQSNIGTPGRWMFRVDGDTIIAASPCDSSPCLNSASCIPEPIGSYTCVCTTGYTGQNCGTPSAYDCSAGSNPCTDSVYTAAYGYYWPHVDPFKFVQCDKWGSCFSMPCAPGTKWSQEFQTCVHA